MLVIIHGWSDDYRSFRRIGKLLVEKGVTDMVTHVRLGNYISLDDDVTLDDIVAALDHAWDKEGLSRIAKTVDVVIHSTGGLVIRHWLSKMKPEDVPINHLVMLAPANFGSPLAHTGRSVLGRAVKGWGGSKLFNTGTQILKSLELASAYSWKLSFQDRLTTKEYYGENKILCTVLVGNSGFTGISALANKPGTDGTVRVSTANLNCAFLAADFSGDPLEPKINPLQNSNGVIAFGIMDDENHATITCKDRGPNHEQTLDTIVKALQIEDKDYASWCQQLESANNEIMQRRADDKHFHGYQNTVFYLDDQYGNPVTDYVIELYLDEDNKHRRNNHVTQLIQEKVVASVHPYGDNPAYRSMLIDCNALFEIFDRDDESLRLSVSATPEFGNRNQVGYQTFGDNDIGHIEIDSKMLPKLFIANRTLLIHLRIKRYQSEKVFEFKNV